MQEDFIHYLWKCKKFNFTQARTSEGEPVVLIDPGVHNLNQGPDFFNARLRIGDQLWAGNVEIHLKASDWYFHSHEKDRNYDNVILHVVWKDDVEVFRSDNSVIPCLPLHNLVEKSLIKNYQRLLTSEEQWINCENDFTNLEAFTIDHWLERIYFERLEEKAASVEELLENSGNNWEAVLFQLMAKNFGLNINGDAFLSMAQSIDFSVVQKCAGDLLQLEALLFGQAGLLNENLSETYYETLQKTYTFLKHKYQLENRQVIPPKYFRLRPENFPSIRLSQLAALYHQNSQLFTRVIRAGKAETLHDIFSVCPSEFWNSHYSFKKSHKKRQKILSSSFVDLIIINGIVPLKLVYAKAIGRAPEQELLEIMQGLKPEANSIVKKFNKLRKGTVTNALQSQGILQLKHHYCDLNKCLQCEIGAYLLHS